MFGGSQQTIRNVVRAGGKDMDSVITAMEKKSIRDATGPMIDHYKARYGDFGVLLLACQIKKYINIWCAVAETEGRHKNDISPYWTGA